MLYSTMLAKKLIFQSSQKNFKVIILNKKTSVKDYSNGLLKNIFLCVLISILFFLFYVEFRAKYPFLLQRFIYCTFCLNIYVSFLPKIFLYFQIKLRFLIGVNKIDLDYYLLFFVFLSPNIYFCRRRSFKKCSSPTFLRFFLFLP
jgi:hypothetical protein